AGMGALREHTMAQMNTSNSFRNLSITHDYANIAGNNAVTQIKGQFLRGLFPDLEDDAERIIVGSENYDSKNYLRTCFAIKPHFQFVIKNLFVVSILDFLYNQQHE
ncbi:26874_t:CDS:2, partial [Racocetra persica]